MEIWLDDNEGLQGIRFVCFIPLDDIPHLQIRDGNGDTRLGQQGQIRSFHIATSMDHEEGGLEMTLKICQQIDT